MNHVTEHFSNWKVNPRKWEITYVASRLTAFLRARFDRESPVNFEDKLMTPAVESEYVDLLFDPEFRRSVEQVKEYSCLDVVRLANLWTTAQLVGPGIFVEVGSYKGGTALHICNAMRNRDSAFYCFDPFEDGGFERMAECDAAFHPNDFRDTQYESVVRLLSSKPNARAVRGFFPAAAEGIDLHDIAFGHIDVDIYDSTKKCLEFLAPRLSPRGVLLVDDVGHREAPGVRIALDEFLACHPSFIAIPMFPCQALVMLGSLWGRDGL